MYCRQLIESEMQYRKLQATLTSKKETIRNLKTDMLGIMKELESIKEENTHLLVNICVVEEFQLFHIL